MDLSIVIVNWNTREYLRRCLESIRANPPAGEFEVIVVDNASSDESAEMVRREFGDVLLVANTSNAGYARGNNQGFRISRGEYVLMLNPDTEVKPGTLDRLLAFAGKHPDAAAVGCRLVGTDGRVQMSCRGFPDPLGLFFEYTGLSRLFPGSRLFGSYRMSYFDHAHEAEVDQPMGACLLLSRKALDDVGMIDEDFSIFFNEVDWCFRARQKGWRIYFTPDAEVLHHGGASTSQVKREMFYESHRALCKFYDKHYRSRLPWPVYKLIMLAISANLFFVSRSKSSGG